MRTILLTVAALALLSSPVLASKCGHRGDPPGGNQSGPAGGGNPGGGGNQSSNDAPDSSADAPDSSASNDRDTDSNTTFAGAFGGSLCADAATSRMVSDWVRGARSLDHIAMSYRPGGIVCLRPVDDASWTDFPTLLR